MAECFFIFWADFVYGKTQSAFFPILFEGSYLFFSLHRLPPTQFLKLGIEEITGHEFNFLLSFHKSLCCSRSREEVEVIGIFQGLNSVLRSRGVDRTLPGPCGGIVQPFRSALRTGFIVLIRKGSLSNDMAVKWIELS